MEKCQCQQILFIIYLLVTEITIIQVSFTGAVTYFLDCTRYFRAIMPRDERLSFKAGTVECDNENGNGEWGTGNGESLTWGIFKSGNL